MDAMTQLIESFISRRAKPIPQALCRQGIALAMHSLVEAVEQPESRTARENMAHAALLSGIALANSGLGMAHGVAAALGVHCRVPHGLACARDAAGGDASQPCGKRSPRSPKFGRIGDRADPRTWTIEARGRCLRFEPCATSAGGSASRSGSRKSASPRSRFPTSSAVPAATA